MRKLITNVLFTGFVAMTLLFNSCQEEFEEIGNQDNSENVEVDAATIDLMANAAANDGSFDNIVDEASCIAIQFPYTVDVAGVQITIDSLEDLHLIEEIFDEFDDDVDALEILFPITITLEDFTEVVIESQEDLRELAADCREGGDDDDIECIDFDYPITLFTFDIDGQRANTIEINSDRDLRRFFRDRDENVVVGIEFPVTLIKYDGAAIVVNSNAELATTLEAARDECDEDDDDDYNDDDFEEGDFVEYLAECSWIIKDYTLSGISDTEDFMAFSFEFGEEGGVIARSEFGDEYAGEWSYEFGENGLQLTLNLPELSVFNFTWTVYQISERKIKFFFTEDNNMILKRDCDDDNGPECSLTDVAEELGDDCLYKIVNSNLEVEFNGLIDFSNNNIHAYFNNGQYADEGNWETTETGLRFNALSAALENLTGDWNIQECGEDTIKLVNDMGMFIVLKEDCEAVIPDVDFLDGLLRTCKWVVKKVKNEGQYIDRLLGYEFQFSDNGVTLSDGISTKQGDWEVGYNAQGQLSLLISIGEEAAVSFDWPLRALTNNRLVFDIDGTGFELLLQRECEDYDQDVSEIRNIMLGGQWNVSLFEANDTNMTDTYDDYDFSFSNMNQVEISINDDPLAAGLWRVIRNYDGDLKMLLNFSDPGNNFAPLTGAYYIEEVSSDFISLELEDMDGNSKTLEFRKR